MTWKTWIRVKIRTELRKRVGMVASSPSQLPQLSKHIDADLRVCRSMLFVSTSRGPVDGRIDKEKKNMKIGLALCSSIWVSYMDIMQAVLAGLTGFFRSMLIWYCSTQRNSVRTSLPNVLIQRSRVMVPRKLTATNRSRGMTRR
jgi:hypothetical protein